MSLLYECLEPGAGQLRKGAGQVLIQPLAARLGRNLMGPRRAAYQIFDFTCALERITMSTMARSKKLVVV